MECLITTLGERLANHQYFAKISKNYSTYNWTSSWKTKKRNGYQLSGKYTFTLKSNTTKINTLWPCFLNIQETNKKPNTREQQQTPHIWERSPKLNFELIPDAFKGCFNLQKQNLCPVQRSRYYEVRRRWLVDILTPNKRCN